MSADRATPEIRFFERLEVRRGKYECYRVLRQLWITADGSTEWRDVPLVRLSPDDRKKIGQSATETAVNG